jgi:uncharacterized cupin superfamily protein
MKKASITDDMVAKWKKIDWEITDLLNADVPTSFTKAWPKSLVSEAKKYKSADEFVKWLEKKWDIVYHGTNQKFDKFDNIQAWASGGFSAKADIWHFFTNSSDEAVEYANLANKRLVPDAINYEKWEAAMLDKITKAEKSWNWNLSFELTAELESWVSKALTDKWNNIIIKSYVDKKDFLIHKVQDNVNLMDEQIKIAKKAKKEWYKWVIFEWVSDSPLWNVRKSDHTLFFDADDIVTEAQLKNIYNKNK